MSARQVELDVLRCLCNPGGEAFWEYHKHLTEFQFKYAPARIIFKVVRDQWRRHQEIPKYQMSKRIVKLLEDTLGAETMKLTLKEMKKVYGAERSKVADEYVKNFILEREVQQMSEQMTSLKFGEHGVNIREFANRIENLQLMGSREDQGEFLVPFSASFLDNWEKILEESYDGTPIGTGFPRFDTRIPPLYPGELGLFLAPTGFGKTRWLVNISYNIAQKFKKRVLYIALDNRAAEIAERFMSRAMRRAVGAFRNMRKDKPFKFGSKKQTRDAILKRIKKAHSRILIRSYPRNTVTAATLEALIKDIKRKFRKEDLKNGVHPDKAGDIHALVVDYAALMETSGKRTDQEHLNRERIANEISSILHKYKMVGWTAAQTGKEVVKNSNGQTMGHHVQQSWASVNPIRIGVAQQMTDAQKADGYFGAYVFKCNRGEDGLVFPFKVNYKAQLIKERLDISPYLVGGEPDVGLDNEPKADVVDEEVFQNVGKKKGNKIEIDPGPRRAKNQRPIRQSLQQRIAKSGGGKGPGIRQREQRMGGPRKRLR